MKDDVDGKGIRKIALISTKLYKERAERLADSKVWKQVYPMFKLSVISDLEDKEEENDKLRTFKNE